MEKRIGPTPNGGDYSILVWLDSNGDVVEDRDQAVEGIIMEFTKDYKLVYSTYLERVYNDSDVEPKDK